MENFDIRQTVGGGFSASTSTSHLHQQFMTVCNYVIKIEIKVPSWVTLWFVNLCLLFVDQFFPVT